MPQQKQLLEHSSAHGFPGLESRQLLQWIEAVNLSHLFGNNSRNCLAQKGYGLPQLLGSKRIRTTAYHPIANGLVERFHRQLKGALKASPDPTNRGDMLAMVLLGICTCLKQDPKSSTAELVYGTTLRLPGDYFQSTTTQLDPVTYVTRLSTAMQQLQPPKVRQQGPRKSHVREDLRTCTHVFVRHDAVKRPLRQPYDGPFKVIKRHDKHFILAVKGL